ncbi:MAG: type I pullulanase, partial [Clostridiales bacterium]|nr:type I pullulanase [Clostridiales bacterium]
MKCKKLVATIISAAMLTGIFTNIPGNTLITKAYTNYSSLDSQAYSGNDLGATYTKSKTTFKVWAPTASDVKVKRYKTGSDSESGSGVIATDSMTKGSNGVWSIEISGDLKNNYYTYLVTVDGRTNETVDIYAKAVGVNGNRGMVIDLDSTDPAGWGNDKHVLYDNPTDAIVWEGHVRDFSCASNSGISSTNKGKFLAFTEKGTTLNNDGVHKTGIDYLKDLGVTHVQLLPIYDYATVDETQSSPDKYNWGYDPKNFNAPEGSYSTNPYDGNVRVNELKKAVQSLHNENIGVIMDVVYNHTYEGDNKDNASWFNLTVPGYYYRQNATGGFANGSGCGNETASDRAMYQKYMIDSILYWAEEYHIDGFRFDLMGLHDVDTMNKIRAEVNKINPNIIIYGEPWNAGSTASTKPTAVQGNIKNCDNEIGAFNDKIRDAIKGSCFNKYDKGFIQGASGFEERIKAGIQANSTTMAGADKWSKQPSQTVTYTSAHDNYSLYDKLVTSCKGGSGYNNRYDDLVQMNKLSAGIILTSQGISFMQAGEEFARTKFGDENSYKSSQNVNQLDWQRVSDYSDLVSWYKGLIEIRKAYTPFRDATNTTNNTMYFSWGSNCPANVVAYTMYNELTADSEWNYVAVAHNANDSSKTVTLQSSGSLPTQWVMIADGQKAGVESLGVINGAQVTVPARSTVVLVDKASFDSHTVGKKGTVTVKYIDEETGKEIATSDTKTGKVGTSYSTSPKEIEDYILSGTPSNANGNFKESETVVTYKYIKDTTPKGTVTVKYVDKATQKEIATSKVMTGKQGNNYSTEAITIKGYTLDATSLPSNATGKYTSGNILVTYYYNEKEVKDLTVHYYNSNKWSDVYLYAYNGNGSSATKYTGTWPGTKMTNEGNGWFSYGVSDVESGLVIFNNGGSSQEPAQDADGYKAEGEVWIKDKKVYDHNPDVQYGNVIVKYVDKDTKEEISDSTTLIGIVGKEYSTSSKSIDGYTLSNNPSNASGTYSNSTITVTYEYSKINKEWQINSFTASPKNQIELGASVKLSATVSGDISNEKYRFYVVKDGETEMIRSYSTSSTATWTPEEKGNYKLYVDVKDSEGNVKTKDISYVVTEEEHVNFDININPNNKTIDLGEDIDINITSTGNDSGYTFRYVAVSGSYKEVIKDFSRTKSISWTPGKAGDYNLYVVIMAPDGTTKQEVYKCYVSEISKELKINSFNVSGTSTSTVGSQINLSVNAEGEGTLQYRFVAYCGSYQEVIKDFSTNSSVTWTPKKAGTYNIYFVAKDSTGKTVQKVINNYVVNPAQ